MNTNVNAKNQMLCAWSGPMACILFFIAVWPLAGLLPPPISPTTDPAQVVAFYRQNSDGILWGMVVMLVAATFLAVWAAAITVQIKRIEGRFAPLAYVQLAAGILLAVVVIFPPWIFGVIAFRPERDPQLIMLLSDIAWFMYVWPNQMTCVMIAAQAIAVLSDKRPDPIFPRWLGYGLWAAFLMFLPSCFTILFKGGPLAWNGMLSFWMAAFDFGFWTIIMFYGMRRAILRQEAEASLTK